MDVIINDTYIDLPRPRMFFVLYHKLVPIDTKPISACKICSRPINKDTYIKPLVEPRLQVSESCPVL